MTIQHEDPIQRPAREWLFRNVKTQETRRYLQTELTIDGEMQLFRLVTEVIAELRKGGFPFDRLRELWPDDSDLTNINVGIVTEMATVVAMQAADLLTRAACVLLGIFPFDERNQRNEAYDAEYRFLRDSLKTADVVEMAEEFVQQNDIDRLRAPFARAWKVATAPAQMPARSQMPSITSLSPDMETQPTSDATSLGESSTAR